MSAGRNAQASKTTNPGAASFVVVHGEEPPESATQILSLCLAALAARYNHAAADEERVQSIAEAKAGPAPICECA